jgi:DNA-binding MarR family transcriptional regulator
VGNDAPGVDEMQAGATPDAVAPDAIGIIELELMKLVRHLDTFGRRGSLYVRVDRAGYLAMRMLDSLGPVPVNALAQSLSLDSSTVTRQVTALAAQGLVQRCANPADGRSSTIVLTPEGHAAMREVEQARRRNIEALVCDWDNAGQCDLGAVLARLNQALVRNEAKRSMPAPG